MVKQRFIGYKFITVEPHSTSKKYMNVIPRMLVTTIFICHNEYDLIVDSEFNYLRLICEVLYIQ